MSAQCIRGCISRHHQPDCTCTPECGEHTDHCEGCAPSLAVIGHLCGRCAGRTRDALRAIPELTVHAASRTDGRLSPLHVETDTTRHGSKPHAPSPSPAWDTAEEVFQWALLTARACADENQHRGPFRYRTDGVPARNLTQLVAYITANLGWYAEDIPVEIYEEATGWQRQLTRLAGMDRLTHRLKEPCPTCDRRTLIREDGSNMVECRNRDCGRIWREGEYDFLAHVAVS